jgi:uncharacterized protein GlcG (DUF336 family)
MAPDVAQAKAITALNLQRPSSQAVAAVGSLEALAALQAAVEVTLLPIAGGMPIVRDGRIIGAIGVSGPDPERDEEIAAAALA